MSVLARKVVSGRVRLMFWASRHGAASRRIQSHAMLLSVLANHPHYPDDPHGPHGAQSPHDSHRPHGAHIPHTPHRPSIVNKVTRTQGDIFFWSKKNLDLLTPFFGNLKPKMATKWPQDGLKMASR